MSLPVNEQVAVSRAGVRRGRKAHQHSRPAMQTETRGSQTRTRSADEEAQPGIQTAQRLQVPLLFPSLSITDSLYLLACSSATFFYN